MAQAGGLAWHQGHTWAQECGLYSVELQGVHGDLTPVLHGGILCLYIVAASCP